MKDTRDEILDFPLAMIDYKSIPIGKKQKIMETIGSKLLNYSRKMLKYYFSLEDIQQLLNINPYLYNINMNAKDFFIEALQNDDNAADEKTLNKLLGKIEDLGETECIIFLNLCFEFYVQGFESNHVDKKVDEIFNSETKYTVSNITVSNDSINHLDIDFDDSVDPFVVRQMERIDFDEHKLYYHRQLYFKKFGDGSEYRISKLLIDMVKASRKELFNVFNMDEAFYIVNSINPYTYGFINSESIFSDTYRYELILNQLLDKQGDIIEAYNNTDEDYRDAINIDQQIRTAESVLNKLPRLNEVDSFSLLTMCFQYWGTHNRSGRENEIIREIFQPRR